MTSNEIRKKFLTYFEAKNHRVVRSSSLVPANDPTLLFANAGMNQFKDVFLGAEKPASPRACSSQKCVRAGGKHNDLEQVGRTTRHHTFFEMLGNFSFGDYFKKEAIPWAWELITKEFAIPREKLYVTVFREDDEAETIWANDVGVPRDRIFRLDEKDNFWQMGDTGPCGPCSEIHYDMGVAASDQGHTDCKFPCDCGRYVELWNLVFMQFNRIGIGDQYFDAESEAFKYPEYRQERLPKPSIDTGAGLERLAAVLQGKLSNFDTDLFQPLIQEAAELAKVEYGANHETDVSLRIIADHARAATFLNADGVLPSNEGRGYVLRKIIRRAIRHARKLGIEEPFLYKTAGHVAEIMKQGYAELAEAEYRVSRAIKSEEERFASTLRVAFGEYEAVSVRNEVMEEWKGEYGKSTVILPHLGGTGIRDVLISVRGLRKGDYPPVPVDSEFSLSNTATGESSRVKVPKGYRGTIPPQVAFYLYDTFGMPIDLIRELAHDDKIWVDDEGFQQELAKQRARARTSWKGAEKKVAQPVYQRLAEELKTEFDGYLQTTSPHCKIVAIVQKGHLVNEAKPGEEIELILDHTPFYAESGGQVGDQGKLLVPEGTREMAHVNDIYRPVTGLIAHKAVAREPIHVGDVVTGVVDKERREAIRRNHTATHLLHAALRTTLGPHVKQAGSLVAPDRLRFDFSHYAALGEQDLLDIEDLVNQHVLANEEMHTEVMDLDTAINTGAMALFGEKYGDKVRVVSVADGSFSKELCGGTHVHRTGDIGLFKVISESSVAAGTRRIEALTGLGVLEDLRHASRTLDLLGQALRVRPPELLQAVEKLTESEKKLRKQLEAQQLKQATSQAGDLLERAKEVLGVRVLSTRVEVTDRAAMRQMVDNLRPRMNSGVIVLGSVLDGKVSLIVAVTKDLTDRLDAGHIIKEAVAMVGGKGGGRKDLAEAGGTQPEKLDEALAAIPSIIEKML